MKRFLTDSYVKWEKTPVALSGVFENAPAHAARVLGEIQPKVGGAKVRFLPMCEAARALVTETFGAVLSEGTDEGFVLDIKREEITVYADTLLFKNSAAYSLLAHSAEGLTEGVVCSYPCVEHRSIRFYLPAREEFPFFKRFMELLCALGYNAVVLEIGAAMELRRHPEMNEYWLRYSASMNAVRNKRYLASALNPGMRNSTHTFNAGGEVLSREEVRELVDYGRSLGLEMIPEIPSLSHSEHILGCYPSLAENKADDAPTCACPLNEDLYPIVFDLYDEAIEVFDAKTVHMAHDEWWVYCVCDKCKDKDPGELFAYNVNKCYDYLKKKGVKGVIWGDSLVGIQDRVTGEVHGAYHKPAYTQKTDKYMDLMGKMLPMYKKEWTPDMSKPWPADAIDSTMKDRTRSFYLVDPEIRIFNWYYAGNPEIRDPFLAGGRYAVYGNYQPMRTLRWKERVQAGIRGFSVSNWIDSTEVETMRWGATSAVGFAAIQAFDPAYTDEGFRENVLLCSECLYFLNRRQILSSPRVEITHTFTGKPFDNEDAEAAGERTLLGYYTLVYENGESEKVEVHTDYNIGVNGVLGIPEEDAHSFNTSKGLSKHIYRTMGAARLGEMDGACVYTFAIPAKGPVRKVYYEPIRNAYSVEIKEIKNLSR